MRLDGGPSRTSRAADRQPAQRVEAAPYRSEEAGSVEQSAHPVAENTTQSHKEPRTKKSGGAKKVLSSIAIIVALVVVAAAGYLAFFHMSGGDIGIDDNKYQAVFLSSGQVYFGNLSQVDGNYLRLSGVFYIQSNGQTEAAEGEQPTNASDMQLIKLGDEVHGPEDAMVINRDQVLFFENLKSDGRVAQLISQYQQSGNN